MLVVLLGAPDIPRERPFELPDITQVPPHACTDVGVAECERACNERADGGASLVASVAYGEGLGGGTRGVHPEVVACVS
jgi:hypothetical protein